MKGWVSALTLAVFLPLAAPSASAAVGDAINVAQDGDVFIKLLDVNTRFTDTLTVYSKSESDLSDPHPQDRWAQSTIFTSSTPVGTTVRLSDQQAGFPLLFFLRNESDAGPVNNFTTGNTFECPFCFDLSTVYLPIAEARWLGHDKAKIGFPDTAASDISLANYTPPSFGDYAMRIMVSNVVPVPEPPVALLALLAMIPLVPLALRRRQGDGAMPA